MPFTDKDKHFTDILRKIATANSTRKFIPEFPNKSWNRRGLDHLIKKIDESDSIARKSDSVTDRPRTARHDDYIDVISYRVRRTDSSRSSTSSAQSWWLFWT